MLITFIGSPQLSKQLFISCCDGYGTEGEPCVYVPESSKHHLSKDGPLGRDALLKTVADIAHK